MAIYVCDECKQIIDGDHFPCVDHPEKNDVFCCESCASDIKEQNKSVWEGEYNNDSPKPRLSKSNAEWERNR